MQTICNYYTIHFIPFICITYTHLSFITSFNMGRMYGKGYVLIDGFVSESKLSIEKEFRLLVFLIKEHVLRGVK